jgi:hypothetical protein
MVVVVAGIAALVIGGLLPVDRTDPRFVFRLAWGIDGFPLSQHLAQASRWVITFGLPALALLASVRGSRFSAGLLLAVAIMASVAGVDWLLSIFWTGSGFSKPAAGAYLTLVGSVLVAAGAVGLLVIQRTSGSPEPGELRSSI